jgi:hypothetical protein
VFFHQSIFERLLGTGDLGIESAGEGGQETFADIRRPSVVQNLIYRQMDHSENARFDRIGAAGAAPGRDDSIPGQIDRLDDLRRKGAITEAEFQAKKAELLRRM